jgi:hypothetical protein
VPVHDLASALASQRRGGAIKVKRRKQLGGLTREELVVLSRPGMLADAHALYDEVAARRELGRPTLIRIDRNPPKKRAAGCPFGDAPASSDQTGEVQVTQEVQR